ncbi:MAG TPA: hypothetical protein VF551_06595, partial [Chthoniobacterales bacterium]
MLALTARRFALLFTPLLLMVGPVRAENSQETRPALLKQGPQSLVNVLSVDRLVQRGQGDGLLKFDFYVNIFGEPYSLITFGGSENTQVLSQELVDQLERARFIPAKHRGETCGAFMTGTLVFATSGGKPRLRIFLNQEKEYLNQASDFIAPQQLFPRSDKFKRYDDPFYRIQPALVAIKIDTDVTGKILDARLLRQY